MAPEQVREAEVGAAADQFSFCVALFEGLYRARPFRGQDIFSVRRAILEGSISPPPPSDVPAWLQRAVLRGLAPQPGDRFASMRELMDAMTRDLRTRRRYGLVIALAACLVGGGSIGAALWLRPEPSAEDLAHIETLVGTAAEAGARGDFVYPPIADPAAPTVYRVVRELEQTEGAAAAIARGRALELRTQYSLALVDLGDAYWQTDGGAPFAADYYAAALVFDESHPRARERASLTRGELAELIAKAERDSFSEGELVAAQSLAVLAETNEDERARKYAAVKQSTRSPSPTTVARLDRLVESASANPNPSPSPSPVPPPVPPPVADAVPDPIADSDPEPGSDSAPGSDSGSDSDSGFWFAKGKALLRADDVKGAERAFHRVLQIDRRHAGALAALAQIDFDRSAYSEALRYATRGVAVAPRDAKLRILLGDAHLKTLGYDAARRQYEKAAELGHVAAKGRLALLKDKLGR
jgi:tetratricopeptide (TPR) repeat protein